VVATHGIDPRRSSALVPSEHCENGAFHSGVFPRKGCAPSSSEISTFEPELRPLRIKDKDSELAENGVPGSRRTSAKLIRFSPDELQLVLKRARSAGRPVACYIRESSLGPAPRARRAALSDAVIRTLGQLATRLSLLATQAKNQHLAHADEFQQAVSEVLDIVRDIE
jgi:mobilization protein NikA